MMKNKNLFLILLLLLSFSVTAQSYKGHRLKLISTYLAGVSSSCGNPPSSGGTKVNIYINNKIPVGNIYGLDFGDGFNYYYVTFSKDSRFSDEDENINGSSIGNPINPCSVNSFKGHILYGLGTDLDQAITRCNDLDIGDKSKVNLQLTTPLIPNKIYGLNFGEGFKYYYVFTSSFLPSSDEDYSTTTTNISGPFSCDDDGDGVVNEDDNCPNNANPDQADLDNDGNGNACDNLDNRDFDNDGVDNYEDQCPNEAGPASNNGCPVMGSPDLQFEELNKSDFRSDCNAPVSGCVVSGHYIYKSIFSNGMDFKVGIKNNGEAASETVYLHVYLWANDDPNVAFYKPRNNVFKLDPLNPGQNRPFIQFYFDDKGSFFNGDIPAGNYTLQVRIEDNLQGNSDFSEEISIPFQVRAGDPNKIIKPNLFNTLKSKENLRKDSYQVKVFNIQGIQVDQKVVVSKEEENRFIKNLPKGFYIIKNGDKTYKIVK